MNHIITFIFLSGLFLEIGYLFDIKGLMFHFQENSTSGVEIGGSIVAFVLGAIGSYLIGKYSYKNKAISSK